MPIHLTIFSPKSVNQCRNHDKVRKTKCHMHKHSGQIPIGRLGKPPCQLSVPEEMIYQTACGQLQYHFCTFSFWFTFIYAFVISISIRELIGIITSNYRLVDNRSYIFISSHQYFMIHFLLIKYISHPLIKLHFVQYNCLHFTSL